MILRTYKIRLGGFASHRAPHHDERSSPDNGSDLTARKVARRRLSWYRFQRFIHTPARSKQYLSKLEENFHDIKLFD